jgi:hypothetical protein
MQRRLEPFLAPIADESGPLVLRAIRVTRHKPGRRCLIEYDLEPRHAASPSQPLTFVGKVRAKGLDAAAYELQKTLWNAGFDDHSADDISVPQAVGVIPDLRMWLQRKVGGMAATPLLAGPDGLALAPRVAEAIHKLHQARVPTGRSHTMADELRILHERLVAVARHEPAFSGRIQRILAACEEMGAAVPAAPSCGIHRDFYADQVIVDRSRLYLLDLDLYCQGHPALDVGNFLGHLVEQSVRTLGRPDALADREQAFLARYAELAGEVPSIRAYTVLTLIRHIALSRQFPDRRPFTESLMNLGEHFLGIG